MRHAERPRLAVLVQRRPASCSAMPKKVYGPLLMVVLSQKGPYPFFVDTTSTDSAEQQRDERRQVAPPHHPGVGAWRFDAGVSDVSGREPLAELPIGGDQPVFGPARDPQQPDSRVGLRAE